MVVEGMVGDLQEDVEDEDGGIQDVMYVSDDERSV